MNPTDAVRLLARLKAAFPRMTLDEMESEVLLGEVCLLADPLVLNAAVDRIIRTSERFPTIAEIRAQYRASNEATRPRTLPAETGRSEIPEWIHVWFWQQQRTRTERQAAREGSRLKAADRAPVPMRDFPQYEHPGPNAYTIPEYEAIRADWAAAASPKISTVADILASI